MTRRKITPAAIGTAALLLITACSSLPGTDGSLVDDWALPPQTTPWRPASNTCYKHQFVPSPTFQLSRVAVPCTEPHQIETVHVGSFPDRPTPPRAGAPEWRTAYAQCLTATTDYLGGDWRSGRLWLAVAIPSDQAWSGGARWYRCDLWEVFDQDRAGGRTRVSDLRGALRGSRSLALTCYQTRVKNDEIESIKPVACTTPHDAEFAGVYVVPDIAYPTSKNERDQLALNGCRGVVAAYVNVPNDANLLHRLGLITSGFSATEWTQGNRAFRCHLWLDKQVTRSYKAAGPAALPVG